MLFVDRQVNRLAVNLACTRINDLGVRIEIAAGFQKLELGRTIQFHIQMRIDHRVEVANTAGEIENVIHAADQMIDHPVIAHVCRMNLDPITDVVDVMRIAALSRQKSVDDGYFHVADFHEPASQVATYEPKATRNQYGATSVFAKGSGHGGLTSAPDGLSPRPGESLFSKIP